LKPCSFSLIGAMGKFALHFGMFITGLGTANPPHRYKQSDCWEAFQSSNEFVKLTNRSRTILRKVLVGNNGIATRHLALPSLKEAFNFSPDILQTRFAKNAPVLAALAAESALKNSGTKVSEIDAVIVSTCTGYLCPGLTSYVGEQLRLRANVLTLDLVGQGCGAALPNLRTGEALIAAGRAEKVLSICVEVCSAAFYLDDDPGVLISACLFGDGAAAAVLSAKRNPLGRNVKWCSAGSTLSPNERDLLRFEHRGGLLRNILSPEVPTLAAQHAESVLHDVLNSAGRQKAEIKSWIFHAGGRDVLLKLRDKLQLETEDLCWSAKILNEFGNLSSPFVYFVLKSALEGNAPGGLWWMASFGAGFSSHGALLEVE
jgi:polyketide synthase Type III